MQQQKDDVVQALAQMVQEKLTTQKERDDAMKEMEELRKYPGTIQFPRAELEEATNNFDNSLMIGQGATGSVYKAQLRHTVVAIKRLINADRLSCGHEMDREVNSICKVRHPHILTLIGTCKEPPALIYEYMKNGNLDEQMNASPITDMESRIRIAAEICDALLFIHSCDSVHCNIKPSNILLDAKLTAKIDFGFCYPCNNSDSDRSDPSADLAYIAPEYQLYGPQTSKSDIYSFGVILLHMLTGHPALFIADDIQREVDAGNLQAVLDATAGNWSFDQALQLAMLGLKCCDQSPQSRPDLLSEIWPVLDSMRSSLPSATSHPLEESRQHPAYFLCPTTQEIMSDPHVTAVGHTYEKAAIQEWLDGGHRTSPKTNLLLSHSHLIPNHALRSAIREWE